jgi:hypothetical protein
MIDDSATDINCHKLTRSALCDAVKRRLYVKPLRMINNINE